MISRWRLAGLGLLRSLVACSGARSTLSAAAPGRLAARRGRQPGRVAKGITSQLIGFGPAVLLTVCSWGLARTKFIYGPGLPVALVCSPSCRSASPRLLPAYRNGAAQIRQCYGVVRSLFIVFLVVGGFVRIMNHLNHNRMPM